MFKDYYAILGISPHASGEEVRKGYKKMALRCHPDKAIPPEPNAEEDISRGVQGSYQGSSGAPEFTEIKEAYDVLSDVPRRYLYDLSYQQALEQQQQLQQEFLIRQKEKEKRHREREMAIQLEREQAREREAALEKERAREAAMMREKAAERTQQIDAEELHRHTDVHRETCGGVGTARNECGRRKVVEEPSGAPPQDDHSTVKKPRKGRKGPKKPFNQRRDTDQPGAADGHASKTENASSADTLPNIGRGTNTIHFSGDTLSAPPRLDVKPRGYPLEPPEAFGLSQEYYRTRAVKRAMHLFFSDVLPLVEVE